MNTSHDSILDEARAAYGAGLCLLPVAADGTKRPDVPAWTAYQTARPTAKQMRAFRFQGRTGFGMISGPVSGHRAAWDFDCPDTYRAFMAAAEASGLGDLVRRIEDGYCDQTPAGGRRWIVQDPPSVEWRDETLARRPGSDGEPNNKTLIELPTFAILAPSHGPTHPSGRPYRRVSGDFATIATVTADEHADLVALARTFDVKAHSRNAEDRPTPLGDRPGDVFNRHASWTEVLEPAGWRQVHVRGEVAYWRRPGKPRGVSATTNHGGTDRLHVFTSSTTFEPDRSYSKFAAYAVLHHGGNFVAAAQALAAHDQQAPTQATQACLTPAGRASVCAPSLVRPILVRLQDVQPESVTWLWPGRLAAGKVALLVGDPGLGKSWIALDLAARVSAGRPMPDGTAALPPGDVLVLSAEDGLADTIRPRLDALGADVARVHHLAVLRVGEHERAVQLADTAALELAIDETRARLIIIDPVSAYLGSTDSHRDAEVRGLMAPVAALAERSAVAILGIMHLAKQAQRRAIYRAVGSIAFAAAARIVLAVAVDPEGEDRRILASVKSNLAAAPAALAYTLRDGSLVWSTEPVAQMDVEALLSGPAFQPADRRAIDTWLRDVLADGPVAVRNIQDAARQAGVVWRTVERAKSRLGVRAFLQGFGASGRWSWRLPEADSPEGQRPETDTQRPVSVSEKNPEETQRPTAAQDVSASENATTDTGAVPRERTRF